MRIPSGKTDQKIFFVAVDSTDLKTRETGLTTFTVYRSRNGGTATVYTTPTVAELDATNMPGVYCLTLDEDTTIASGSDSEEYCVHTTQASMAPVTRTVELYRRDTTTGNTLDVTATGAAGVDWANVENKTTSNALTGTTIATTQKVDVETIKTQTVTCSGGVTVPAATLASTTNIAAGTITTVTTVTNQLTAAAIATGVWQDATAGDFTAALSVGKSVMNGVALGTGLTVNAVTGLTASNLDATISSRMATYTQPAGFLAATFPSGTVANTTNITGGTITTTTNLTTNNDKTGYALSSAAVQAIWDALTSALTTVGSIGKLLVDNINATIGSRSSHSAADVWAAATRTITGGTITTYTGDTPQTGDCYARLGAPAGVSVSADVAAVKTDTAAILVDTGTTLDGRLPAALTAGGNMKADALALNGSTTAAAVLAILNGSTVVYQGTVTGAATTTTLIDSGLTQADTDWWKGRIIIFTSVLTMQATDITAFDPALDKLTFTALTAAPTGATYVII